MTREHAEARRSAIAGLRSSDGTASGFIPGLYGLRTGRWVEWDRDPAVRLARVDAMFGAA